jgi:hypothetical protein
MRPAKSSRSASCGERRTIRSTAQPSSRHTADVSATNSGAQTGDDRADGNWIKPRKSASSLKGAAVAGIIATADAIATIDITNAGGPMRVPRWVSLCVSLRA